MSGYLTGTCCSAVDEMYCRRKDRHRYCILNGNKTKCWIHPRHGNSSCLSWGELTALIRCHSKKLIIFIASFMVLCHLQEFQKYPILLFLLLMPASLLPHYCICYSSQQEGILVLKSIGLQIKMTNNMGRIQSSFVDINLIQDVFINEAVTNHAVVYYLVLLVKNEKDPSRQCTMLPLFMDSATKLDTLIDMYKSIQEILCIDEAS